jgi:DNA-directed RNA polymerase omega subunit
MGHADISIETLFKKTQSLYKLVVMVSRRATELNAGAASLIPNPDSNVIITALQEIAAGRISHA